MFRLYPKCIYIALQSHWAPPWDKWPAVMGPKERPYQSLCMGKVKPWIIWGIEVAHGGRGDCGPLGENKLVLKTCPPSLKLRYQIWTLTTVFLSPHHHLIFKSLAWPVKEMEVTLKDICRQELAPGKFITDLKTELCITLRFPLKLFLTWDVLSGVGGSGI